MTQGVSQPSALPSAISSTASLQALRDQHVPRGVSAITPIFAAHAEGATLWDVEGRAYIDFAGGIGVLNTGHRHPAVVAAITAQVSAFTHTCFQVVAYESYLRVAERLNAMVPVAAGQHNKTLQSPSGGVI
jgi:4-aminobutyrate aminotransferase / (S)-3-amino-2-methylpropionate transaminase / 5-aminovalerate transaminase